MVLRGKKYLVCSATTPTHTHVLVLKMTSVFCFAAEACYVYFPFCYPECLKKKLDLKRQDILASSEGEATRAPASRGRRGGEDGAGSLLSCQQPCPSPFRYPCAPVGNAKDEWCFSPRPNICLTRGSHGPPGPHRRHLVNHGGRVGQGNTGVAKNRCLCA